MIVQGHVPLVPGRGLRLDHHLLTRTQSPREPDDLVGPPGRGGFAAGGIVVVDGVVFNRHFELLVDDEDPDEFGVCAYTGDGSFKHGSPPVPTRGASMWYVHAP